MKTILIDAGKCIDCRNCQIACKDEFCDNDWSPLAAKQGSRQYWIRIVNEEAGQGERVRMERVPLLCQQCKDAPCMKASEGGAAYRRQDGIVIIDPEKAKGQRKIMDACPYGVIYWNEKLDIPQKCTMCAHLQDAGKQPRCTTACPTDALTFIDADDLANEELLPQPLEKLYPQYGTDPQIIYQDLPKPFIGGEVCNGNGQKCLADVVIEATHQVTGQVFGAVTDEFGDFWLKGLEPGFYTVAFMKDGYAPKTLSNVDANASVNVEAVKLFELV